MSVSTFTPELARVQKQYRLALRERDAQVLNELARQFTNVNSVARREMLVLANKISAKVAAGETVTPGWLYQQGRLAQLRAQIGGALDQFVNSIQPLLDTALKSAVQDAIVYAQQMAASSLGPAPAGASFAQFWTQLDQAAIQSILANTAPGGPVHRVLESLAPQGATQARDIIVNGVAQGYNPRRVAQELRQQLDVSLTRAQTITRTEIMRVHRDIAVETYRANPDVVQGYIWSSALDDRTCEDCWGLEGEWFDSDFDPEAHINCRCTLVPDTRSYADMGFGAEADAAYTDLEGDDNFTAPMIVANGGSVDAGTATTTGYLVTKPDIRNAIERTGQLPRGVNELHLSRPMLSPGENRVFSVVEVKGIPLNRVNRIDPVTRKMSLTRPSGLSPTANQQLDVSQWLTSGAGKFAQLSPERQLKILGPAKYRAYKDGAVQLRDFIGHKDSPVWGKSTYAKSLKEILGADAKKYYRPLTPAESAAKVKSQRAIVSEGKARLERERQAVARAQQEVAQQRALAEAERAETTYGPNTV